MPERSAVEFGVLGPTRAVVGGRSVVLPAKQRVLLATLLLQANKTVSADTLIAALWDDKPTAAARNTLHGHIKRLRRMLCGAGDRIGTSAPGYRITIAPHELDLTRFTTACANARTVTASGDWTAAARALHAALAQWRGEPLADVPLPPSREGDRVWLTESRLQALESRIEADLHLGRHNELIPELRQLVSDEPMRERFTQQLMVALYRCGRQTEALAAFQQARGLLRTEVGIDPGPGMQRLHQQILAADPSLAYGGTVPAETTVPADAGTAATPAQLPPDTPDFSGRDQQITLLQGMLADPPVSGRPGAVTIAAITGMGGVGKTALAVHAAHRLKDHFADGQLYADLQGTGDPLRPVDVMAGFLRDLGLPDSAIPASEADRGSRYRTLLANRKILVVLDDARDAAQVRPLLPGSASCGVIVTSRNSLPGLAGATHLVLDVMSEDEARSLFATIVGGRRVAGEPDATRLVLSYCAGLPLAIRIAASRLVSRPGWGVDYLRARLASERSRLGELAVGDLAIRASFAVSYNALPGGDPHPARVFRLLGLSGAPTLSLQAVAALAGQPTEQVIAALEILVDAHLLESPAAERYRLHDLLRSYARELGESADQPAERGAALHRVFEWYCRQAVYAAQVLSPGRYSLPEYAVASPAGPVLSALANPVEALVWFGGERSNLLAVARQAADQGLHRVSAQIADAMWEFFQRTCYPEDWLVASEIGVAAARGQDDQEIRARLLHGLGQAQSLLGRFADAHRSLTRALVIRKRAGDKTGEAKVLNSLAVDLFYQSRPAAAMSYLEEAKAIHVARGDQVGTSVVLTNIGLALLRLERYAEAVDQLEQALRAGRETGNRYGEGLTEAALGETYLAMGSFEDAVEHLERARAALRATAPEQDRENANILCGLGQALAALGRVTEARRAWQAVIPVLDRLADPKADELRRRLAAFG